MERSTFKLAAAGLIATSVSFPWDSAWPATLPVPCIAGLCGANNPFVGQGQATASQSGSKLTVNQTSQNVTLNWQSFNISADGTVQFVQPGVDAVALNRIWDANPSQIFGALQANGRVYLINHNGIIFGSGAQVNVGSLVASTLDTSIDSATNNYSILSPATATQAAFQQVLDASGKPTGSVTIQQGATLQTPEGGQILVFAPQITNEGNISTPGGQTVLAAGTKVYLAAVNEPSLRGLLVEVAADSAANSTVTNGKAAANASVTNPDKLVGQIVAERGNITLAGLAVNQSGRVTATTSVNENGSIRLQAYQGTLELNQGVTLVDNPGAGGVLKLAPNSVTEVNLATADTATTVDSVAQPKSDIALFGSTIDILDHSTVRATSGTIEATAARDLSGPLKNGLGATGDGSRVYVAPNATLDVSGATVVLPVSSNAIPVQLRGTELADSPLQQNGPLRGQTVYVDVRNHGTNADGTTWQGTPLANVSGEIAAIQRNVAQRNLTGGTISLESQGDVIVAPGSVLNVSGGEIQYTAGVVNTTMLLTSTGKAVPIGSADPNALYLGTLGSFTLSNAKWGTSKTYSGMTGAYEDGYVEGKDAGTLKLSAPRFVLDGTIDAAVAAGRYQRLPTGAAISGSTYFAGYAPGLTDLYRNYDQVPKYATLNIGGSGSGGDNNLVVGNVTLQAGDVLPRLRNTSGGAFDPLQDVLPVSYDSSVLRPDLIGPNGFGNVSIATNGKFDEPAGTLLALPAGGSFSAQASVIDIEGAIDAPGGAISASAVVTHSILAGTSSVVSLALGSQAALTARGEWVNDNPLLYGGGYNTAPLYTSGGSIKLTAQANVGSSSELLLAPGSLIDVTGGAQLTGSGALAAGNGGSITLAALPQTNRAEAVPIQPAHVELGASLRGFGLSAGGTLNISAGSVCIAAADCSHGDLNTLWLSPGSFAAGGFSSYQVTAAQGSLTVAPGTTLKLQQQNLVLPSRYANLPDAATLPALATPVTLADLLRHPVNLSLTQQALTNAVDPDPNIGDILLVSPSTPSLVVGRGAAIVAEPGASVSLASNARIVVDGLVSAPGGSISLSLAQAAGIAEMEYAPSQGIWLGSSGVLDAHGIPRIQVGDTGLRSGSVLSGGTVSLSATRGAIELLPGSVIDVSGSTGMIDVSQPGRPTSRSELVASAGGSVVISAAESMVLGGTFKAAGGAAGPAAVQAEGGSLTVELNGKSLYSQTGSGIQSFPNQIVLSQALAPLVVAPGAPVPDLLEGTALVSADTLAASGFGAISFSALPFNTPTGSEAQGGITFNGNVDLSAPYELRFNAATYTLTAGATAIVHAPYVSLGNSDVTGAPLPALRSGTGTLDVSGGFIELYGSTALEGVRQAFFDSSGDLRLRGIQPYSSPGPGKDHPNAPNPKSIIGGLFTAGDLELSADQVYPSTLSQFVIGSGVATAADSSIPTTGSITIHGTPDVNQDLLSAGGTLTLRAATVLQEGVLRAPFGTIDIEANSISLAPGSLTSTSANGVTVPFGTTQGGFDWVYPLLQTYATVYGVDPAKDVLPPSQRVILNGAHVAIRNGAVIDVSGGGDMQAYEWVPGVNGTKDVLSQTQRPGQFAVVPSLKANVAPYDPNIWSDPKLTLNVGDSVYLSGVPGLPAGSYTLLPARYALLPGAFLVSATSGFQDIQSGQTYSAPGGGWIVSGYRTIAGTSFGDTRTSGFTVVPASIVLGQAQYQTNTASQFFSNQLATLNAGSSTPLGTPRLPQDSGVLEMIASASLSLDTSLRAKPGTGGLGAAVDISSAQIYVAADNSIPAPAGQLLLTTASLDQLGAQSLLIGGHRGAGTISTDAQTVTIASGAALTAPEVLLAANDEITVSNGASVTASGSAAATRQYTLTGDGAFLSVSAGPQATVLRNSSTGSAGVLNLASGSSLTANGGSIYLDGAQNVITQGNITAKGGDLALQSHDILIGTPTDNSSGTVLSPALLAGEGLRNVLLAATDAIKFYGNASLAAQNLTLDTQTVVAGASGSGATVNVAGILTLQDSQTSTQTGSGAPAGGSGTSTAGATAQSGSLVLNAADVKLGPGTLSVSGFQTLSVNAANSLTGAASATGGNKTGQLHTSGDLAITASRLTTQAGVASTLDADGTVTLGAPAQAATLAAVTDLGGSLSVSGRSIELGTRIDLPSGKVSFATNGKATGSQTSNITLDSGAVINVAGVTRQYNGTHVPTPGGTVTLTSIAPSGASGNIQLAAGSTIDVSAADGGSGGVLSLTATSGAVNAAGTLHGSASADQGSSFSVDALQFGFSPLNSTLGGGFSASRSFRLRGAAAANNDLTVGAGDTVKAHNISLEADQGRISIVGTLDASGTSGGTVLAAASGTVEVGGSGTINARATGTGGKGGRVDLDTTSGSLLLDAGSVIDVSGGAADAKTNTAAGAGGTVALRLPRKVVTDVANNFAGPTLALNGQVKGASQAVVEAYKIYTNAGASTDGSIGAISDSATGTLTSADIQSIHDDTVSFMNGADVATFRSNLAGSGFVLEPGVEVDEVTTGTNLHGVLSLSNPWDLYSWRYGTQQLPGILTLRAAGGVTVSSSLSDGFDDSGGLSFTLPAVTNSWSYRIAAGADLSAADPLTVVHVLDPANHGADFQITNCSSQCLAYNGSTAVKGYSPHLVRTGNGYIDVSASGNFLLGSFDADGNSLNGSQASLLYTAGVSGPGITIKGPRGSAINFPAYPVNGGDVRIAAAGNAWGATDVTQFVNAWLWRLGAGTTAGIAHPTLWTVDFQSFQQGIGALGGGDVLISAGGNVKNISASIPTIGAPLDSTTLQVTGGGDLTVQAGGSILGGSYFSGAGNMTLRAGNDVAADPVAQTSQTTGLIGLAPLLGLGASTASISARGNVEVSGVVNPTLLNAGRNQPGSGSAGYFSTYGADASVTLTSAGGDITLNDRNQALENALSTSFAGNTLASGGAAAVDPASQGITLDVLPPTLQAHALTGNINLGRTLVLTPSAQGNLQLYADTSIVDISTLAGSANLGTQLVVSDSDPALLPSPAAPASDPTGLVVYTGGLNALLYGTLAPTVYASIPVHESDSVPVQIVARTGDVAFQNGGVASGIWSAKPVEVAAGRDVVNLDLVAQNLHPSDVTSITAGRDIVYPISRDTLGSILSQNQQIALAGPGELELSAGRNVNLGTTQGIDTRGNQDNANLPTGGAGVSIMAGTAGHDPRVANFVATYIDNTYVDVDPNTKKKTPLSFDQELISFVEARSGETSLDAAGAKSAFHAMNAGLQREFVEQVYFDLLRYFGRKAATAGNADFSGAFKALQTLFPGADAAAAKDNPYAGNIELYFSKVYTQQGGGISLLAPGGEINVGLAQPPSAFSGNLKSRTADTLGLVARSTGDINAFSYDDFQVNQSRVFAADGGNILVWSTAHDIDAGRGSKTALSASPASITLDPLNGRPIVTLFPPKAGSGIQTLASSSGVKPGNVDLYAPHGVVNANDAGIVAGNLTVAATAVLGSSNISVSGTSTGVPLAVTGLGAAAVGASSSAAGAMTSGTGTMENREDASRAPAADTALGWLDVFVLGFGEDTCKAEDTECLKRQSEKK